MWVSDLHGVDLGEGGWKMDQSVMLSSNKREGMSLSLSNTYRKVRHSSKSLLPQCWGGRERRFFGVC